MKHIKNLLIISLTALLAWGCSAENDFKDPVFDNTLKSAQLVSTNNAFGLDLFRLAATDKAAKPNIMISPASVSLALGMAYNGAETTTREAFEEVLNYEGLTRDEINSISRDLINVLVTNTDGNLFEIGNSIWYRNEFPVHQGFLDLNQTYFDAEVEDLDFSSADAIKIINDWVSDKTHGKINSIIDDLSPEAMMVLINALYFNCTWDTEFDKELTDSKNFYREDGTIFGEVEMMTTESTFSYISNEDISAVELPYKNDKFSMHLILPSGNSSVGELISELDGETWNGWMNEYMQDRDVQVTMPKFKFDFERKLGDDLKNMGLEIAFTGQADFSGISDIDLMISEVIHKTFIDVNEEGTEAAAVTAIVFETTSVGGDQGPLILNFNRPFLFAITENSSKSIVFMGTVSQPEYTD